MNRVLGIGLAGIGVGAGARSLMGLSDLLAQKHEEERRRTSRPAVVQLNVPTLAADDGTKTASDPTDEAPSVAGLLGRWGQRAVGSLLPSSQSTGDFLAGRHNVSETAKPWFWPAAGLAAAGGLAGGYGVVNSALTGVHTQDKQKQLEDAKNEYRRALVQQYSADSTNIKRGAAQDELGRDLHELYTLCKEADWWTDAMGHLTGGYGLFAGLVGTGAGVATYNWAKSRSPEERLANAIKQRERLRWATRPPEIYAVAKPSPVRLSSEAGQEAATYSPGANEEEDAVRKVAAAKEVASLYKP